MPIIHRSILIIFIAVTIPAVELFAADDLDTVREDGQDEILREMTAMDALFGTSLNITGERESVPERFSDTPPTLRSWQLSINDGEIAYREEVIETLKWEDFFGDLSRIPPRSPSGKIAPALSLTAYLGPERSGLYQINGTDTHTNSFQQWRDDRTSASFGEVLSLEDADAASYTIYPSLALWSIGRGFTDRLDDIESVKNLTGGLTEIRGSQKMQAGEITSFVLHVDPDAMYIVRKAKCYIGGDLIYEIKTEGTRWDGQVVLPERIEVINHFAIGAPISTEIKVASASFTADKEFLADVANAMKPPYPRHLNLIDFRSNIETTDPNREYEKISDRDATLYHLLGEIPDKNLGIEHALFPGENNSQITRKGDPQGQTVISNTAILEQSNKMWSFRGIVFSILCLLFLTAALLYLFVSRSKDGGRTKKIL